jgi:hypothetical protein
MPTVIDAIYENGVFKPLTPLDVQEHRHYRLYFEPATPRPSLDELITDPALAAEIERRTTILPDGRRLVRLSGLFSADLSNVPDDEDPVAEALAELRRERAKHFDEEWPEPTTTEG